MYETAQDRVRIVYGFPGGAPLNRAYAVHMDFTNANEIFHVLRVVRR